MSVRKAITTRAAAITEQAYKEQAHILAARVIEATNSITDEANLRHELEKALEVSCGNLGIPWTPFQWERRVSRQFVDVVHGAIIIEYEASKSFSRLIPLFFDAIKASSQHRNKTLLLFSEWKRLFGQVIGVQSDRFKDLLKEQGKVHQRAYEEHIPTYLFALHTYIALIAKLVAALALSGSSQNIADTTTPIKGRIEALETGQLFIDAGVANMLSGDFFSWYVDDEYWMSFQAEIENLIQKLSAIDFDVSKKSPDSTRDLFKGIYQFFVPGALRHALGEFYTPDWLAEHALDTVGWHVDAGLLDPTCGSGTFLLEALRRRLTKRNSQQTAGDLLSGLYGIDLNPLAVLTAKGSLVVYLAPYLDQRRPVRLPVFLADAINPTNSVNGIYYHNLQTERGIKSFAVPASLIHRDSFFEIFSAIRALIDADCDTRTIFDAITSRFALDFLDVDERESLHKTIQTLVDLYRDDWDGIWCSIIADRFAAGAISPVPFICGNPPWVKWSHLPPDYAAFIKPRCVELGVFSEDSWVGGIESDISTVITYEVIDKWLSDGGKLGFFITGTIFTTESSAGFRRFELRQKGIPFGVDLVEDFQEIRPFEKVNNHATFFVATKNQRTHYPVIYRYWMPGGSRSSFANVAEFREQATARDLYAYPMPGKAGGPWLKGSPAEHALWNHLFAPGERYYQARKGVTTDRNGIFGVRIQDVSPDGKTCRIQNAAEIGRTTGIPAVTKIVETEHLFPLLRGRNISAFRAQPERDLYILLPQRGKRCFGRDAQCPARNTSAKRGAGQSPRKSDL